MKITREEFELHRCDKDSSYLWGLIESLQKDSNRLDTIERACGYVGNGSASTVKIFQDDATYSWHMESGKTFTAWSDDSFSGVIDDFESKYYEDEYLCLHKRSEV